MNPRKLALTYLGWCPGISTVAEFIPDRKISKKIMIVSAILTTLAITQLVIYSAYLTINEAQARREYARKLFIEFEIVDVKEREMSAYYREDKFISPLLFRDADTFIRVARQQGVRVLYRVADVGRLVYYYFESPVYYENYMVYEVEIIPPIRGYIPKWLT